MDYSMTRNIIETHYSARLVMHETTQAIYLDKKPFNIAEFRDQVFRNQGIVLDDDKSIHEIIYLYAKKHTFSPIKSYLDRCLAENSCLTYDQAQEALDEVSSKILQISDLLEKAYITRTLVAAVKRVYEPGCQHDTALILRSDQQGLGKTSFFTELAGAEWFTSLTLKNYDKDEIMTCHSKWFIELGECEGTIKPYTMSKLKSFITQRSDTYRKPYDRDIQTIPRHFILVGTTNQRKFLQDETGDRRFWVVDIDKKIDLEILKLNRNLIWASAVVAYQNNHPTYLNETEQAYSNAYNRKYKNEDVWAEIVTDWVLSQDQPFTLSDVLTEVIGKRQENWKRSDQARVKGILHNLGFKHPEKATRVNGKSGKYYTPTDNALNSAPVTTK